MAIEKINKETTYAEGRFICVGRSGGRLTSGPARITKITNAQLTVEQEGRVKLVRLNGISGYLVDTEEEGMNLFNALVKREAEITTAESKAASEARARVIAEWKPVMEKLLGLDKV